MQYKSVAWEKWYNNAIASKAEMDTIFEETQQRYPEEPYQYRARSWAQYYDKYAGSPTTKQKLDTIYNSKNQQQAH